MNQYLYKKLNIKLYFKHAINMFKPQNLFLILALFSGILAFVFGYLVSPSANIPERQQLAIVFTSIAGVMGTMGIVYLIMEKLNRPVSSRIGMVHFIISLLAVACGVICTITAHDGIENAAWTQLPKYLAIKLFIFSVAVFFFGIVISFFRKNARTELR